MSLATPLTHLSELAAAEDQLARDLAARSPAWAGDPSGLPGWTRAHVTGHLAGNALGLLNLVEWAASGTETPMYPSKEVRAAEIERRAGLEWSALLDDLAAASERLLSALHSLTEPVAERHLRMGSGAPANVCDIAAIRIREIEIHRVDLAGDYAPSDWAPAFTLRTFGELAPFFLRERPVPVHTLRSTDSGNCWQVGQGGPDLVGAESALLAWLIGRPHVGVQSATGGDVPPAPPWV